MTVRIRVKNTQPYKEFSPKLNGRQLVTKFGCKLYDVKELEQVQKEYQALMDNPELEKLLAVLEKLNESGDRTSDEFYIERDNIKARIDVLAEERNNAITNFCKEQVLYIKQASFEVELEDGVKDISVPDTREAKPIESLWETSEECLAVLLDVYLNNTSLRDSLLSDILAIALNVNLEAQLKN